MLSVQASTLLLSAWSCKVLFENRGADVDWLHDVFTKVKDMLLDMGQTLE